MKVFLWTAALLALNVSGQEIDSDCDASDLDVGNQYLNQITLNQFLNPRDRARENFAKGMTDMLSLSSEPDVPGLPPFSPSCFSGVSFNFINLSDFGNVQQNHGSIGGEGHLETVINSFLVTYNSEIFMLKIEVGSHEVSLFNEISDVSLEDLRFSGSSAEFTEFVNTILHENGILQSVEFDDNLPDVSVNISEMDLFELIVRVTLSIDGKISLDKDHNLRIEKNESE